MTVHIVMAGGGPFLVVLNFIGHYRGEHIQNSKYLSQIIAHACLAFQSLLPPLRYVLAPLYRCMATEQINVGGVGHARTALIQVSGCLLRLVS
jgi:hypothetical protein